jgi:hypothetical protein
MYPARFREQNPINPSHQIQSIGVSREAIDKGPLPTEIEPLADADSVDNTMAVTRAIKSFTKRMIEPKAWRLVRQSTSAAVHKNISQLSGWDALPPSPRPNTQDEYEMRTRPS